MKTKRKIKTLELLSAIGFSGKVCGGLNLAVDRGLVYPVGVGVGVWDREGGRHSLLHSHTKPITAVSLSKMGNIVVTSQNGNPGCQALVVIWNYHERKEIGRYAIHREEIVSVGVSSNEEYVSSLGGSLDGFLLLYNVLKKAPICSVQAGDPGLGSATHLCFAPITPTLIAVGGKRLLKLWSLRPDSKTLTPTPVQLGLLERNYTCLQIDDGEQYLYAGTKSGDVVKVRINMASEKEVTGAVLVSVMAPRNKPNSASRQVRPPAPGIQALVVLDSGVLIVGDVGGGVRGYREIAESGGKNQPTTQNPPRAHGTLKYTHPKDPTRPLLHQLWSVEVRSAITSISLQSNEAIIGTSTSEIYTLNPQSVTPQIRPRATKRMGLGVGEEGEGWGIKPEERLISTCPSEPIYDVAFPRDVGELVVSAGMGGVRVWNVRTLKEALKVNIPGLLCSCSCVSHTLDTIITGWSDGRIRGLGASSGRVVFKVDEAHHGGVNAVVCLHSGKVVSAGRDGRVRVWEVLGGIVKMLASQKEHRGEVTRLSLAPGHNKVLSCGGDGSCVLWALPQLERLQRLRAHTVFLGGAVLESGEIVTCGSDGALLVWDRDDGSLLADLPVSSRPLTTLAATSDDSTLVTAGEDAIVRVWNWEKGRITHEGTGHSGAISQVALSPDGRHLVSGGKDGALLFWKLP